MEENTVKKAMRWVNAADYHLETMELITAKLIQAYFATMEKEEAAGMMESILSDTVINFSGGEESQTTVEGAKLAVLINTAATSMAGRCGDWLRERDFPEEVSALVLDVLHSIDGKLIVQNVSPEFLCFLTECYKALTEGA